MKSLLLSLLVLSFAVFDAAAQDEKDFSVTRFTVQATIYLDGQDFFADRYDVVDVLQSDSHRTKFDVNVDHSHPSDEHGGRAEIVLTFDFKSFSEFLSWRRSEEVTSHLKSLHSASERMTSNLASLAR